MVQQLIQQVEVVCLFVTLCECNVDILWPNA